MASGDGGVFQLPEIGKKSPFKGFLDISIVTQKLRKNMRSQDGSMGNGLSQFEFQGGSSPIKGRRGEQRGGSNRKQPIKATAEAA